METKDDALSTEPSGTQAVRPLPPLMAMLCDRLPGNHTMTKTRPSNELCAPGPSGSQEPGATVTPGHPPASSDGGAHPPAASGVNGPADDGPVSSGLLRERCPKAAWQPDPGSTMHDEALDATVSWEELRRLRSYLYEVRRKQPLRRLLISSALSGEGKTFVSANLARTMAQHSSDSVLVVDGDLRLSRLHSPLGAAGGPGLSEYLQGEADLFSIIQRGPLDNLFFIAGGTAKVNAADLIVNGRLEMLLQRLAPAFDWILMDSPPTLLVTDASLLASLCDGVLFVVRAGVTPVEMARKALRILRGKPLLGTVLNGSALRTPYADYYRRCDPPSGKKKRRGK